MPNIPCPNCGRQISDQSKRCLYCARPLTADASADVSQRAKMLAAMYSAGVGLPKAPKRDVGGRLREQPVVVQLLAVALMAFVRPIWAYGQIKRMFRP